MFKRTVCLKAKALVIFIALLILPIPASSQTDNCCSVDRQCNTDEQWVKGYWAYQNNQCAAPSQQQQGTSSQSQPQTETSVDIDNCCFVDRQCETDDDWTTGYWAFQNNQCAVPTDSPSQAQPREAASEEVNNCCFTGWQCDADDEWQSGYFAFQQDQCASQSQWQNQWSQLQRQQRQSGDQQQSEQNGDQRRPRQNDNQQRPRQNDNQQRGRINRITIDFSDPNGREYEYEDGRRIVVQPITHEKFCELYPYHDQCGKEKPEVILYPIGTP